MKKVWNFVVNKRIYIFFLMIILTVISSLLISKVKINEDLSKYLPNDSKMKIGLNIIQSEFAESENTTDIKIMYKDLNDLQKEEIHHNLETFSGVNSVTYNINDESYNKDLYTLYLIQSSYTEEKEIKQLISEIEIFYKDYEVYSYYNTTKSNVMNIVIPVAAIILLIILFLLTKSFFEPIILLITIGIAILLNMGTNIIFGEISDITYSIAAVLQLVLSIDYSIILINRYNYENEQNNYQDKVQAMKSALQNTFKTLISSSLTTFIGLLVLLIMSFTIGKDMGLVLAKGVFISLICVFTVLPCLIIWSNKLLILTNKQRIRNLLASKRGKAK